MADPASHANSDSDTAQSRKSNGKSSGESSSTLNADVSTGLSTEDQIDRLSITPERPLLICDADEVLFRFVAALEHFIAAENLLFELTSYRLTGSIKTAARVPLDQAETGALLKRFFDAETATLPLVDSAAQTLTRLREHVQVVILTNISAHRRVDRQTALARHGLTVPVVTNSGLKGPAFRRLAERAGSYTFFIDDSLAHLDSARDEIAASTHADPAKAHFLHFADDHRIRGFARDAASSHPCCDTWHDIETRIQTILDLAPCPK